MKHKCEWETTGGSTRCIVCGKPKKSLAMKGKALKEYMLNYHKVHPQGKVKV